MLKVLKKAAKWYKTANYCIASAELYLNEKKEK